MAGPRSLLRLALARPTDEKQRDDVRRCALGPQKDFIAQRPVPSTRRRHPAGAAGFFLPPLGGHGLARSKPRFVPSLASPTPPLLPPLEASLPLLLPPSSPSARLRPQPGPSLVRHQEDRLPPPPKGFLPPRRPSPQRSLSDRVTGSPPPPACRVVRWRSSCLRLDCVPSPPRPSSRSPPSSRFPTLSLREGTSRFERDAASSQGALSALASLPGSGRRLGRFFLSDRRRRTIRSLHATNLPLKVDMHPLYAPGLKENAKQRLGTSIGTEPTGNWSAENDREMGRGGRRELKRCERRASRG